MLKITVKIEFSVFFIKINKYMSLFHVATQCFMSQIDGCNTQTFWFPVNKWNHNLNLFHKIMRCHLIDQICRIKWIQVKNMRGAFHY